MDETILHDLSTHAVCVHRTGWYAFFCTGIPDINFGGNHNHYDDDVRLSQSQPQPRSQPLELQILCSSRCDIENISFESAEDVPVEENSDSTTDSSSSLRVHSSRFGLPLVYDGYALNNIKIGMLIHIEQDSFVRVVLKREKWKDPAIKVATSSISMSKYCDVRWQLMARILAKDACYHSNAMKQQQLPPPLISTPKKRLVCAECNRLFSKLLDVSNHMRQQHSSSLNMKSCFLTDTDHQQVSMEEMNMWTSPLQVVYNDDFLSIVIKPQGMAVMGGSPSLIRSDLLLPFRKSETETIFNDASLRTQSVDDSTASSAENALIDEAFAGGDGCLRKPRPVHRLDAGTGGLLVIAKTTSVESTLKKCFAGRTCHKTYLALVIGQLRANLATVAATCDGYAVIDIPLSNKPCRTLYRCLKVIPSQNFGHLTLVELLPVTGRKHQLRKHLQLLGHSILGDTRYICQRYMAGFGSTSYRSLSKDLLGQCSPYSRLCLWAVRIQLPHPKDTNVKLDCRMPEPIDWLEHVIQYEQERWEIKS